VDAKQTSNSVTMESKLEAKRIQELEEQIQRLQEENARLRSLNEKEINTNGVSNAKAVHFPDGPLPLVNHLSRDQVERYSRQLLLQDGFGVEGQLKLLSSSVLIVGAGGIGSTVILYLAACGVGRMTVVDFDEVDVSNLHRQVIHKSPDVGMNKAVSACRAVKDLNPTIECIPVRTPLTYDNALQLVSKHDCVVDASDNPQTRYLINDACVLAGKPLVSGSAIGTEGQLTVYNYKSGPCYRCLYPKPSASEGCKTCADNGVLGPVPGLIGVLQALETIKVLTNTG
jgi:adenylyltransferase/sulfurtransferase